MKTLRLLSITLLLVLVAMTGCTTMWSGGAPKQSFNANKDIKALAKHFEQATQIDQFYDIDSEDKETQRKQRDEFITGRMVLVDLRYIQFIQGLTRERQLLDSASDFLIMSLNLAGAGAAGATTKTVLASIAAGLGGTKVIIDRDFFYQKTVPALIAAMNAQRAAARVPLMKGLQQDIDTYRFHTAVTDVRSYYEAGTFVAALIAIQADAAVKESDKKQDIQDIVDLGPEYYDILSALRRAARTLTAGDLDKAWTAFEPDAKNWAATQPDKTPPAKPADVKAFQALFTRVFRSMTQAQKSALYDRLVRQGLIQRPKPSS